MGTSVEIEPLIPDNLARLRLSWSSRFDLSDIDELVRRFPGLSWWAPKTGEYVIGGRWRHRDEIVAVLELSANTHSFQLLRQLMSSADAKGKRLLIVSEHHESRRKEFYSAAGFELIEEILIYELTRIRNTAATSFTIHFDRVNVDDPTALAELIQLDQAAFPWLWWNSSDEFANYGHGTGVDIYLGRDREGEAVSYVGTTRFRTWGHLDRIAVLPGRQGEGIGLQALDWAVQRLSQFGARRIGLSTQARNLRSRRLYERYGFHRVPSQDYALYGCWLGLPQSV